MRSLKLRFKASGGVFKEYFLTDKRLFLIEGTNSLDEGKLQFIENGVNFIGRVSENNGIKGKIQMQSFLPNNRNTITATVIGNYKYVKFQEEPYYCSQNINKLTPLFKINGRNALYLISHIQKFVSQYNGKQGGYKLKDICNHKILLPTIDDQIDFQYMENYISEIETAFIKDLNNYIEKFGLNSSELTFEEKSALHLFTSNEIQFKSFTIGDLFEQQKLNRKRHFNKSKDVSKIPSVEYNLPLINAKDGNNGIMYYGRECDFDSVDMSIDIVADGAVSTGNVYAQPQKTGVLYNAYLIKLKKGFPTENILLFCAQCIQKVIKSKFGYDNKAVWDKVKNEKIWLPIDNSQIDFKFIENYVNAIKKLTIQNVLLWKDKQMKDIRI